MSAQEPRSGASGPAADAPSKPPGERIDGAPLGRVLARAFRSAPDIMVVTRFEDGTVLAVNDAACERTGFRREELLGRQVGELGVWTDDDHRERYRREIRENGLCTGLRTDMRFKDGGTVPVIVAGLRVEAEGGDFLMTSARDVSALERTEEAIRASEQRTALLSEALAQAAESILITDTDGAILYVNPAFERITGYGREEVLGRNPRLLKSGRHDARFYEEMWAILGRGEVWKGRLVNRRKDDALFVEEAAISPVRDAGGKVTHYVGVKRDVTREAELESRLRQSQKMEAMGALAGGIAHDFNNILYAISGYARLAMDDVPAAGEVRANLEQVLRGARRAADLVRKILTFSRQTEHELRPLSLQRVLEEVHGLVRASLPATIEVTVDADHACRRVLGDPAQLQQVLLNLCANAYQAMQDRDAGRLRIALRETAIDADRAAGDPLLRPGSYALLSVSDTGPGIDPALADRIFEPFFTTRPAGSGTGLGLATVHGIVRNHGGSVEVRSEPGRGAEFRILLPVRREADGGTEAGGDPGPGMIAGRVLYVDDVEVIARLGETALRRSGFAVTAFTDGREALAAFAAAPDRYDVVVTDLTMPGLTGLELARKIWEVRPGAPVILCTGFSQRIAEDEALELGFRDFLLKPIDLEDLAGRIRRILAAQP